MTVSPESIQVGRCYLMTNGQIRRALNLLPGGRLQYERRVGTSAGTWAWIRAMANLRAFADLVEREVSCDWTPAADEVP